MESQSHVLAMIGWASVLAMAWLFVLRLIPSDAISWGFFAFFFILAIFASAAATPKMTAPKK